jgi:hypothetical protein
MKNYILIAILCCFMCSCGTPGDNLTNASSLAVGAGTYELLKDESDDVRIGGAIAAAVGTKLIGNHVQSNIKEDEAKAYKAGYNQGRKDVAHQHYDLLQRLQRSSAGGSAQVRQFNLYEFPQPMTENGINYAPSTTQIKLEE